MAGDRPEYEIFIIRLNVNFSSLHFGSLCSSTHPYRGVKFR